MKKSSTLFWVASNTKPNSALQSFAQGYYVADLPITPTLSLRLFSVQIWTEFWFTDKITLYLPNYWVNTTYIVFWNPQNCSYYHIESCDILLHESPANLFTDSHTIIVVVNIFSIVNWQIAICKLKIVLNIHWQQLRLTCIANCYNIHINIKMKEVSQKHISSWLFMTIATCSRKVLQWEAYMIM